MISEYVKTVLKSQNGGPRRYRGPMPSNLGNCERLLWHQVHSPDKLEPLSAETLLLFEEGKREEILITEFLERCGFEILNRQKEIQIKFEEIRRPAFIDGYITGGNLGSEVYTLELKSMSSHAFAKFRSQGFEAVPYYVAQMIPYLYSENSNIAGIILCARNRENGDLWDEVLTREHPMYQPEELAERIRNREETIRLDNPPPRPYNRGDSWCSSCIAHLICWGPLGEVAEDSSEKVRDKGAEYIDTYMRIKELEEKLYSLRTFFDIQLDTRRLQALYIKVDGARITLRPNVSIVRRKEIDELALRRDHPELYEKLRVIKESPQLRFEIRLGGRVISH